MLTTATKAKTSFLLTDGAIHENGDWHLNPELEQSKGAADSAACRCFLCQRQSDSMAQEAALAPWYNQWQKSQAIRLPHNWTIPPKVKPLSNVASVSPNPSGGNDFFPSSFSSLSSPKFFSSLWMSPFSSHRANWVTVSIGRYSLCVISPSIMRENQSKGQVWRKPGASP